MAGEERTIEDMVGSRGVVDVLRSLDYHLRALAKADGKVNHERNSLNGRVQLSISLTHQKIKRDDLSFEEYKKINPKLYDMMKTCIKEGIEKYGFCV